MNQVLLFPLLELIDGLLWFYQLLVILAVILNLLAAFNILNTYNRGVFVFLTAINRFTDPVLFRIRRIIPTIGGLDFSPVIALFLIHVLRNVIRTIEISLH